MPHSISTSSEASALLILHEQPQLSRRLHAELAPDFAVYLADSIEGARRLLEQKPIGVLLVSRTLAVASGPSLLNLLSEEYPRVRPVVVDAAHEGDTGIDVGAVATSVREALGATSALEPASPRRESPAAAEAAAERLEVFGTAAHDLRNPLTVILSLTELLLHESTLAPSEVRQFLESIRANADEMHRLLDDLQEIARLERGRTVVTRDDVAIAALIDDALTDAGIEAATVVIAPAVTSWPLDAIRMRRALSLLAADAATRARATTTLRASIEAGELLLEVCDDGDALAPDALRELAASLLRGRRRACDAAFGTGLGPALAARLIEAHGGSASVASAAAGTTVRIRIPRG